MDLFTPELRIMMALELDPYGSPRDSLATIIRLAEAFAEEPVGFRRGHQERVSALMDMVANNPSSEGGREAVRRLQAYADEAAAVGVAVPMMRRRKRAPRGTGSLTRTTFADGRTYWYYWISLPRVGGRRVRKAFTGRSIQEALDKAAAWIDPERHVTYRACTKCQMVKPATEFSKSRPSRCLACQREYMRPKWRAWYNKNLSPTVRRRVGVAS